MKKRVAGCVVIDHQVKKSIEAAENRPFHSLSFNSVLPHDRKLQTVVCLFFYKKHINWFCANKNNGATSSSFYCVPKLLTLRRDFKRPSTQTQILCKVWNSFIATKSHKNLSSKFQAFLYKCDKLNSNVAVADRNQLCVVEKETRKYLRQIPAQ